MKEWVLARARLYVRGGFGASGGRTGGCGAGEEGKELGVAAGW